MRARSQEDHDHADPVPEHVHDVVPLGKDAVAFYCFAHAAGDVPQEEGQAYDKDREEEHDAADEERGDVR